MVWTFTGGLPETRCGKGSMLASTESVRAWLPQVFRELRIKTVTDAPCGDGNWMSKVDLTGIDYWGQDADQENVELAKRRGLRCCQSDILGFPPPPAADLLICRDFLQHLPDHLAFRFIEQTIRLYKYAAFTSHDVEINKRIERAGDYRPLNMTRAPFMWRPPFTSVADGKGRILGLWRIR